MQRDHERTNRGAVSVHVTLLTASRLLLRVMTVSTKQVHEAASCCRIMRFTTRLHVSIRRSASLAIMVRVR